MTTTMTKPSDRSLSYLTDLVKKRQARPGENATDSLARLTHWLARKPRSQKDVSELITKLLAAPVRTVYSPAPVAGKTVYVPYPSVPEAVPTAKFALLTELLTNLPDGWKTQEYLFFEVKSNKKYGRVVRRLTGAPGSFKRSTLPAALATELFGHLENPEFAFTAARTFGEIYKICGRCAAELTDDTSRERKFGPICWALLAPWRDA